MPTDQLSRPLPPTPALEGPSGAVPPHRGRDPLARTVAAATRCPWLVLLAGALVLAAAVAGLTTGMRTTGPEDLAVDPSAAADRVIAAAGLRGVPAETVVVTARGGGALDPDVVARLTDDLPTGCPVPPAAPVSVTH